MRIILSRKGTDSGSGGLASPILPDGTMISLPIPDPDKTSDTGTTYDKIIHNGIPYSRIISELSNGRKNWDDKRCHVDPDIENRYGESEIEGVKWEPAFGQHGASQSHLQNHRPSVGDGDIFLFYGWFRYTDFVGGKLKYITKGSMAAGGKHIIWGYMQVGEVITDPEKIKERVPYHPHSREYFLKDPNNAVYLPRGGAEGKLSFDASKRSYGLLKYDRDSENYDFDKKHILDLTKEGCGRSQWDLERLRQDNVEITYHKGKLGFAADRDYFQASRQGQEFIIDPPVTEGSGLMKWLTDILSFTEND